MPFKNPQQKKQYNRKYYQENGCKTGSYNTIGISSNSKFPYLQYPSYLDHPDEPHVGSSFKIGRRRVREYKVKLQAEYPQSEGYSIWINKVEGRGLDVRIWKNDNLHTIMEITNYKKTSNLSEETAKRYLEEFNPHESVRKIIIVSYPENIEQWKDEFENKGITMRVEGYQA